MVNDILSLGSDAPVKQKDVAPTSSIPTPIAAPPPPPAELIAALAAARPGPIPVPELLFPPPPALEPGPVSPDFFTSSKSKKRFTLRRSA
jgi:hypothetical protein